MLKVELIGNLGADCELRNINGREIVTFRVAHTDRWTDTNNGEIRETTQWVSCLYNGNLGGLREYLKKGVKVFVRGNASTRLYSSPKTKQMECGLDCNVWEIELCGGLTNDQSQRLSFLNDMLTNLDTKGWENYEEIPAKADVIIKDKK